MRNLFIEQLMKHASRDAELVSDEREYRRIRPCVSREKRIHHAGGQRIAEVWGSTG